MQIFSVITKGGYVMYPLIAVSVVFLAVLIERWYVLSFSKEKVKKFVRSVRKFVAQKDLRSIYEYCQKNPQPASRILIAGLRKYYHGLDKEVREAMDVAAMQELPFYEKRLGLLVTIANVSPLLGLLGTVTGMIRTFSVIATVGVGKPAEMASGISEALITTAAGLTIAIPTVLTHYFLSQISESIISDIEKVCSEVLDLVEVMHNHDQIDEVTVEVTQPEEGVEEHVSISSKKTEAPA
ncbi:MAG: MotA/TolQ/ExbB proton channel family protein [Atribacterota bacterium]